MKKTLFDKAIQLADRKTIQPDVVVVTTPKPEVMSERLYTRITPTEMKRLKARVGTTFPTSTLLRNLLIQYLADQDSEHGRKKK